MQYSGDGAVVSYWQCISHTYCDLCIGPIGFVLVIFAPSFVIFSHTLTHRVSKFVSSLILFFFLTHSAGFPHQTWGARIIFGSKYTTQHRPRAAFYTKKRVKWLRIEMLKSYERLILFHRVQRENNVKHGHCPVGESEVILVLVCVNGLLMFCNTAYYKKSLVRLACNRPFVHISLSNYLSPSFSLTHCWPAKMACKPTGAFLHIPFHASVRWYNWNPYVFLFLVVQFKIRRQLFG